MTTLILSVFFSISASAYEVEVDGIYYNIVTKVKTAEVIKGKNEYSGGDVTIPETITVDNVVYNVTSIGEWAFWGCTGLTSITIPNSVTSIGECAFSGCTGLTSITIPNSVTSIGDRAFSGCTGLTSITIPNSVTSIGEWALSGCTGLTSITIPNSVTSIGNYAFSDCPGLTSITIPNSVTSIGDCTFWRCTGLTSITIPNSLTYIGQSAFRECSGLTSVTIPNSVTSIGRYAFSGCTGLTSITIPNSVTSIGTEAFAKCSNIENVYCYAENFSYIIDDIFKDSYIEYATLHVPSSALSYYQTKAPWSGFGTIKALEGADGETKKCETPTISFVDGKLTFSCATEGAKCNYTISCPDAASGETSTENSFVTLNAYYDITCYAKAEGYVNSDVATAKLYWLPSSGSLEGAGINNVSMRGIAIQSADGFVTISGLDNNETVSFYGIDGKSLGSAKAMGGTATFAAQSGSVVVAKIGKESLKIAVK